MQLSTALATVEKSSSEAVGAKELAQSRELELERLRNELEARENSYQREVSMQRDMETALRSRVERTESKLALHDREKERLEAELQGANQAIETCAQHRDRLAKQLADTVNRTGGVGTDCVPGATRGRPGCAAVSSRSAR